MTTDRTVIVGQPVDEPLFAPGSIPVPCESCRGQTMVSLASQPMLGQASVVCYRCAPLDGEFDITDEVMAELRRLGVNLSKSQLLDYARKKAVAARRHANPSRR